MRGDSLFLLLFAGLRKLRQLVRSGLEVYVRHGNPDSYRTVLQEIKQREIYNIVVDTDPKNIEEFLRGILQLQMNDYKYHYLFTTFVSNLEFSKLASFTLNQT